MHYKITVTMLHFKNILNISAQMTLVTINTWCFHKLTSLEECNGNRFDENMNEF